MISIIDNKEINVNNISKVAISCAKKHIEGYGLEHYLDTEFKVFVNVKRKMSNGQRVTSTTSFPYKEEFDVMQLMIEEYGGCDKSMYLEKLKIVHTINQEYEKENPDTYVKTKVTKKAKKQTSLDLGPEFSKSKIKKPQIKFKVVINNGN